MQAWQLRSSLRSRRTLDRRPRRFADAGRAGRDQSWWEAPDWEDLGKEERPS